MNYLKERLLNYLVYCAALLDGIVGVVTLGYVNAGLSWYAMRWYLDSTGKEK